MHQQLWQPALKGLDICVCIVAYRSAERETVDCLLRDVVPLAMRHRLNFRTMGNDALIWRSRSVIMTEFEEYTRSDILVMIDADTVWCPGAIERIVESAANTRGIVGGVVPKRMFNGGCATRFTVPQKFTTGRDALVEASYVGAAFMAMHRDALLEIRTHHNPRANSGYDMLPMVVNHQPYRAYCMPYMADHPDPGKVDALSEDWALCARAVAAGVPVHADAWPVLSHKGEHIFTIDDAFAGVQQRYDEALAMAVSL